MEKTTLIQVYSTLNPTEHAQFKRYIASPFFNTNQNLVKLANEISAYLNKKRKFKDKSDLYKHLFQNEKYNDLKIRHLFSDLLKLLKSFMAYQVFEKNPIEQQMVLLKNYRDRHLNKQFEKTMKHMDTLLEKHPYRDTEFYRNHYILEAEQNVFLEENMSRSTEPNLQKTMNALDVMYIVNKLRYACHMLNYVNVMQADYQLLLIKEIMTFVRNNAYENIPAIGIYYQILNTFESPEKEENYFKLKYLINEHTRSFPSSEALIIYNFAMNYCVGRINEGDNKYLNEIFDLYKTALQESIIFKQGVLSPWYYKNITVVGLRLGEYKWVKEFLQKYKTSLPEYYQENAYTYNLAKYYFYREKYTEVIKLLHEVEYQDIFYSLDSKAMLLKTYYELDELDAFESLADSFKVYLRRKKNLSDSHRRNYLNLVKYVQKLYQMIPEDQIALQKLQSKIKQAKHLADKNWILLKLNELM